MIDLATSATSSMASETLCSGERYRSLNVVRQGLKALPAYIPLAVFRKPRILLLTAIPASTHHGDGCQQAAIARQIAAQALVLIVMSVGQVGVGALVHEQGTDGILGYSQPGSVHRHHRIVPAPGVVPVPVIPYPLLGMFHHLWFDEAAHGEDAHGTQYGRVVADEPDVAVGFNIRLGSQISVLAVLG